MKTIIQTPFGNLQLSANETALTSCLWTSEEKSRQKILSSLLESAIEQLHAYFKGVLHTFDVPLALSGTPFQQSVWQALQKIPYGQTCSYQAIAHAISNPKAVRAVGSANGKNPLCIFIPCHRVINASGKLGGYSGGIAYKEALLQLEHRFK